ncbi:rhodanese-like domain-containing protein [uncultured Endozoicomonas sp.]|uniref:rhodanese-like domain-containing protein n=1 Tax=uncultured Endozoicomonas sp. TaxID=432652 RepID=UPI00262663BA|nr:rhodanese-like domain-containing protein [uncultured Endozoicomonas sp.]
MEQFIEFVINHPLHVGALAALVGALAFTEMRKGGQSVSTAELTGLVNRDLGVVLDVREKADFAKGHIVNAINIPFTKIKERASELDKYREQTIIVVDAMGQHSGSVVKELKAAGFTQVVRLSGGMNSWTSDSLPVVKK